MESRADSPLLAEFLALLERRSRQPMVNTYGFPDFRGLRRELGLSVVDVADRWKIAPSLVRAIEFGWQRLRLGEALQCCRQLGAPLGALFHDADFEPRPLTKIYAEYARENLPGARQ